jgi:capsule polysaccharide export protein KpsC/LpsZ
MGGVFHDQILAADMLAKALPKGWKLYIKEHADQWALPRVHTGRYPGYYKMLSRHKNVELISVSISGFDLIQNAKATATIGGSTAMESVVKGKPVFVFGYAMYGECDGMFHINTFESCQRAMKVIEEGYMPDQLNVLRFFQALKNVSVGAYIHKRHEQGSKYSYEESIKNMTEGLYNACRT